MTDILYARVAKAGCELRAARAQLKQFSNTGELTEHQAFSVYADIVATTQKMARLAPHGDVYAAAYQQQLDRELLVARHLREQGNPLILPEGY
ncbi:hypothetical protein [Nonomuraea sp. NPDC049646]|uniref:hypothetical protein n=1 Tax=unclassified Nonomuraea TaxID=2593643 RepID=UPI00378D871A